MSENGFEATLDLVRKARRSADDALTNAAFDPTSRANEAMNDVLTLLFQAEEKAMVAAYWHGEESKS